MKVPRGVGLSSGPPGVLEVKLRQCMARLLHTHNKAIGLQVIHQHNHTTHPCHRMLLLPPKNSIAYTD